MKGKKPDEAAACVAGRKKAMSVWDSNDYTTGESEDVYFQLCFERKSLFEETDLEANILKILRPVYEHQFAVGGGGGMKTEAFDLIDSAISGNNIIEASAGTGTTYSIEGLYVRILLLPYLKKNIKQQNQLVLIVF